MTTIYHNPCCGKSREALKLVHEHENNVTVVEYLKSCPDQKKLEEIVGLLGIKPEELIRKNEKIFKENYKGKTLSDEDWIQAMVDHPILIERPIVIRNKKAVIGRPPENVEELY